MLSVAIIVLHFGNVQETILCLKSLQKLSKKIKHTIFVVDNGTKNVHKKDLQKIIPSIKVIINKKNIGFSEGNNVAIKKAIASNFSHIFLLNNDTVVNKNILEKLLLIFKDPLVGIAGTTIVYENQKNTIWFNGGYINHFFAFTRHKNMNKNIDILSGKIKQTDFITGAAMMIKSEVFKKIGLLPKEYFLYWEDVDFCYKARQNGFLIKIIEEPLVYHKVSASTGIKGTNRLSLIRAYYYARNPFIFIKKFNSSFLLGVLGQIAALGFYLPKTQNKTAAIEYIKGFLIGIKILFI